ncbi:copia protein, partial [Tanacetum coccineum]
MVAKGYTQEEGIDYDEVFTPVTRIEAIRLFLAYASFMGFIVYQMDVKSAFLYGTIEEEVYVCQTPGFEDLQFLDKVYKIMVYQVVSEPVRNSELEEQKPVINLYLTKLIMSGSQDEIPPSPPPPPSSLQTPTQQTPHTVSTNKLPILKKGEYDIWAMKMEHYLAYTHYPIWEVIQNGNGPVSITADTQ